MAGLTRGAARRRTIHLLVAASLVVPALAVPLPVAAGNPISVTTLSDTASGSDGVCSLREAIVAANTNAASGGAAGECGAGGASGSDSISFAVRGTIQLASDMPAIASDVSINGGGTVTIDGMDTRLPIEVLSGVVTLERLTITNGYSTDGAVRNESTLTVRNSSITSSNGYWAGGIYNDGTMTIVGSTISGNSATAAGGIRNSHVLTIANSTVADNVGSSLGGGILTQAGASLTAVHTTVTRNASSDTAGIWSGGTTTLYSTLVVGNGTSDITQYSGTVASYSSLVSMPATGILDPAGLRDNGGPTKTVRLLSTATQAIGKASNDDCGPAPVSGKDQRGVTRPAGACDIGAVERETTKPTMTAAPKTSLRSGVSLSGSSSRARVTWAGTDNAGGSGVVRWTLQRSVNGGSYSTISSSLTSPAYNTSLGKDKSYRFRARATDGDGNVSSWSYGPTFRARLIQNSSSAIGYAKTWTTGSSTQYSGGSVRYSKTGGASATYTATGRSYAFVTTKGPTRGKAKIYVNGTLQATIDLYAASAAYRVQAWSKTYASSTSRTIKVVVSGTSGRPRVDLDAFAVLR